MTPAKFISLRKADWKELDELLKRIDNVRHKTISAADMIRFARLYRSSCTDLSFAGSMRLPYETRSYLEQLVSRSHSNLYSQNSNNVGSFLRYFSNVIPVMVFRDVYVRLCLTLFYVPFFLCLVLGFRSESFARTVLGEATIDSYLEMHEETPDDPGAGTAFASTGFYVMNNVSLDLLTFGLGILGGVGSVFMTLFNAVHLGTVLGFLLQSPASANILSWICGHAPFELTAVAFSAAAGLRIGFSFIAPGGRQRLRALREEAERALPVIAGAAAMTFIAAFIEAFLAPARIETTFKAAFGLACSVIMILYFGILGYRLDRSGRNEY